MKLPLSPFSSKFWPSSCCFLCLLISRFPEESILTDPCFAFMENLSDKDIPTFAVFLFDVTDKSLPFNVFFALGKIFRWEEDLVAAGCTSKEAIYQLLLLHISSYMKLWWFSVIYVHTCPHLNWSLYWYLFLFNGQRNFNLIYRRYIGILHQLIGWFLPFKLNIRFMILKMTTKFMCSIIHVPLHELLWNALI